MKFGLHAKIVLILGTILSTILVALPLLLPLSGEVGKDLVTAVGRFHIIALHFPICLLLIVPLLELLGSIRPMHYFKDAVPSVLWISILSAFTTCILGFMLATGEGEIGKLVNDHMWGGIFTTILIIIALFIYELNPGQKNKIFYSAYIIILIISIGTLTIGSHHGASLVHGQDYLYAKAPSAIKNLIGGHEVAAPQVTFDTPAYAGLIKPIFQQNCYSCHSELKEKGHYKMDTFENLIAGGKSDTAGIAPGIAAHSEVFTRITLPVNDEKRMPPIEKPQLTKEQVVLIEWWIQTGATEADTIDDLSYIEYPDEVEEIITKLIDDNNDPVPPLDFNTFLTVSSQLKDDYGIDVMLNSQNLEDGVYVVTRNAKGSIATDALNDLAPLAGHVTSINLWKRTIEEGVLTSIVGFSQLLELNLSESNISNEDLASLKNLRKLKSLNLFGTAIGDDSIETLSGIRSLKILRLRNSQITEAGVTRLEATLPRCEVLAFIAPVTVVDEEAASDEGPATSN